jgi:hypothetical protein
LFIGSIWGIIGTFIYVLNGFGSSKPSLLDQFTLALPSMLANYIVALDPLILGFYSFTLLSCLIGTGLFFLIFSVIRKFLKLKN